MKKPVGDKRAGSIDKSKVRCALCGSREPAHDLTFRKGKHQWTARHRLCVSTVTTYYYKRFSDIIQIGKTNHPNETKIKRIFYVRNLIAEEMSDIETKMSRYRLIFGEPSAVMMLQHRMQSDRWNFASEEIERLLDSTARILPPLELPSKSSQRRLSEREVA